MICIDCLCIFDFYLDGGEVIETVDSASVFQWYCLQILFRSTMRFLCMQYGARIIFYYCIVYIY